MAILTLSLFINTNQSKNQYETLEQIDDIYESETVKTKTIDYVKELKGQEIVYYERNITIKKDLYKKGIFHGNPEIQLMTGMMIILINLIQIKYIIKNMIKL